MKLHSFLRSKKAPESLSLTSSSDSSHGGSSKILSPTKSPKSKMSRRFSPSTSKVSLSGSRTGSSRRISEVRELEQVFRFMDANGDGRISVTELGSVLRSLGDAATDAEVEAMVKEVDADGDGYISLEEFIQINAGSEANCEELRAAFLVFDIDRNGFISADELHRVMAALGETMTMEDCGKMIRGVDVDGDGFVDFEEFKVMMRSC